MQPMVLAVRQGCRLAYGAAKQDQLRALSILIDTKLLVGSACRIGVSKVGETFFRALTSRFALTGK